MTSAELLTPDKSFEQQAIDQANDIFAWLQQTAKTDCPVPSSLVSEQRIQQVFGEAATLQSARARIDELDAAEKTAAQLLVAGFDEAVIDELVDKTILIGVIGKLASLNTESSDQASAAQAPEPVRPEPRTASRRPVEKSTARVHRISEDQLGRPLHDPILAQQFLGQIADKDDWTQQALCAQTDPEAFFPEKGGSTREAKKVCLACDVRDECLDYALDADERFGIWGGLSERERRKLKRERQAGKEPMLL